MLNTKALAASASAAKVYVEDVFSTWLYAGNGSTQTITNGIDLSGKGGLVWIKSRTTANSHNLQDTARGANNQLVTNNSDPEQVGGAFNFSFNSNGFSQNNNFGTSNNSTAIYTSWTFRKAAKFFDVVTYTGNGTGGRQIAHNLGTTPGFIIVKRTSDTGNWNCWHRSFNNGNGYGVLNTTDFWYTTGQDLWGNGTTYTAPTATNFTVNVSGVNASGSTYVAYLFAHDAGGFGDSGNDSIIKCGQFSGFGNSASVSLGWEPQWVLVKRVDSVGSWQIYDNARGLNAPTAAGSQLRANGADAEFASYEAPFIEPTRFFWDGVNNAIDSGSPTYIYIAIRRGPMKTPTDATKVFDDLAYTQSSPIFQTTNFVTDSVWTSYRNTSGGFYFGDRLRGGTRLAPNSTAAEAGATNFSWDSNTSYKQSLNSGGSSTVIDYAFRRAPGFFDVVAYTGGSGNITISHNLGVTPELVITKMRSGSDQPDWFVGSSYLPNGFGINGGSLKLNTSVASTSQGYFRSVTNSSLELNNVVARAGQAYIAYLFATCPGVSKVGSYTGAGGSNAISVDCGFTNGARFVLIKRTDSTGDWYIWDTARGIVSGNDPYLLLNSTAAEVANEDYIDPYPAGFEISSSAPAALRGDVFTAGTFIFLAIA